MTPETGQCRKCQKFWPLTREFFYLLHGEFFFHYCKECGRRRYREKHPDVKRLRNVVVTEPPELECSVCRTKKPGTRVFFYNIDGKTAITCWDCWDSRPKSKAISGITVRSIARSISEGKIDLKRSLDEIGTIIKR